MENRNDRLENIQNQAESLEKEFCEITDRKTNMSYNIGKLSNFLYITSIVGGLIAVFSNMLIGLISLSLAIVGSVLLVYKSKMYKADSIDVNLWLAGRCRTISLKCQEIQKLEIPLSITEEPNELLINECIKLLDDVKKDKLAYELGNFTPSLQKYLEFRYERNRYSAALKNKYNKHKIKQLF